jgi:2,3-bisphosphoglycerate-independent phosphoglycerate mutase
MSKIIFIVLDGLGDEEIPELNYKTPLDFAKTPNLDKWAKKGKTGLLLPTFYGISPTSEEGHFSLFGYDPEKYELRRGIVTTESVGLKAEKGDLALRGNLATIKNGKIIDRRAGRIKETESLVEEINGIEIENVRFIVKVALEHRVAVLMKGEKLSSAVTNTDPAYNEEGALFSMAKEKNENAEFTARIINQFIKETHEILEKHQNNKSRELPANFLLLRGASMAVELPSFYEKYKASAACISGKDLYREIGKMMGMKPLFVEGANGTTCTNIRGKIEKAICSEYDFVFVHFKATDTLAEDGDYKGKVKFIEKFDKELDVLNDFNGTLIITADHSTCSLQKKHCKNEIPFLVFGKGEDEVEKFTEKDCKNGFFGRIKQINFLKEINLF